MASETGDADGKAERERTIRERAYAIWHDEGRPAGKDREHWLRAEREHDRNSGLEPAANATINAQEVDARKDDA